LPGGVAPAARGIASWCRERPVRLCVAFGSRALGKERPESDLDLAVWATPLPPAAERLRWLRELTDAAQFPVQLVFVTPRLDPVLGLQIARDGVLLHEAEKDSWTGERVRLWHLYQDSLPFLRAARRQLAAFAEQVRRGA
jgi:predicted nucleotidyltransferase